MKSTTQPTFTKQELRQYEREWITFDRETFEILSHAKKLQDALDAVPEEKKGSFAVTNVLPVDTAYIPRFYEV